MLSLNEQGHVSAVNPVIPSTVLVPHKRQVVAALRNIHKLTSTSNPEVLQNLKVICEFMGSSLEQLLQLNKKS